MAGLAPQEIRLMGDTLRDTFGSLAEARMALARQAVVHHPGSPDVLFALAEALAECAEYDDYARIFRQAYLLKPSLQPKVQTPLTLPNAAKLRDAALALIGRGICYSPVLAAAALASAALGDKAMAASLIDYDRFFRVIPQVFPREHNGADFCDRLAAEIKTGLTYYDEAGTRAIRKAWRNDRMMESALPACRAFAAEIRRQVARYIAALPVNDDHPFIASRPGDYKITAWAVLSHGAGHHIPHIHPKAWMSGVYYVVRPEISRPRGSDRGWLRVGPPPTIDAKDSGWQQRMVEPEPGNLVLMPGYFYHETQAMDVDQERICVAFDVMPVELAAVPQAAGGD